MGLDQYLEAAVYVHGYSHGPAEERQAFDSLIKLTGIPATPDSPSATIYINVAYWRKANAIHNWFANNVDGVDNCQRAYVDRQQLEKLLVTTREAITAYGNGDYELSSTLLTPTSGFFFGSTSIDEWYYEILKNTVEQLERVLAIDKPVDFYYMPSW